MGTVRRKVPIIPGLSVIITIVAHRNSTPKPMTAGPVPPERRRSAVPRERAVAQVPNGDPMSHVPAPHVPARHVARVPRPHQVAAPPNPRKPKLVRDVHGGVLGDLFQLFPDLPRPPRPRARVPLRILRGRRP
jgi:hypothetical protein